METYTVKQMLDMVGMVIPRAEVKINKLYDRKTGEGKFGPWSLQSGEIEDSTGKIRIVFSGGPDYSRLIGNTVILKSTITKHGMKGLEIKSNEYKGNTQIELTVTKAALVVTKEEEPHVTLVEDSPRPPTPVSAPITPKEVNHEERKLGIATCKNRLTQLAGLYDLCWKTVNAMECGKEELLQEPEIMKDIATTLFIQSVREGLADKMPIRTTSKFYNEEALKMNDPKNPGNPVDDEMAEDDIPF